MGNLLALQPGTELVSDYRIERVLGAGGFGITYLADELALSRRVTIKEYFPADFAARDAGNEAVPRSQDCVGDYRWGLDRFIEEAQTLARFDHKNIVRVYRYFQANNTAYMVLSFEEGQSFKGWLRSLGRAPRQKELDGIVPPLLDALEVVHKADYLHRDIAPDNIMIRPDGTPVLIDFGAARGEIASHSKTVSALVKPGYSPYEQYAERSSQQGPWTDIYALAATLYSAVTGKRPPDAPSRVVKDEIVPARDAALAVYRHGFLAAIDKALSLNIDARPQSVAAWRGDLLAPDPAKPGWFSRGAKRGAEAAASPAGGKARGAAAATVVLPPPPDAPGPQGGMLDFIDGVKAKGATPAASPLSPVGAAAAPAAVATPPSGASKRAAAAVATEKLAEPAEKAPTPIAVKPKPAKPARAPRPRAVRKPGEGRRWLPLVVKLAIGAAIAAAAIEWRDRTATRIETHSTTTVASQRASRSPAASQVASASPAGQSAPAVRQLKGHTGAVRALASSDGGRHLVSLGEDQTLRVWDQAAGRLVRTIELDDGPASALAVSGRRALTGHRQGTIALWDLDKGTRLASFKRNGAEIWSLAFLPDGRRFIAGGHDWSVVVWSLAASVDPELVLSGHESAVQSVVVSPDGETLASGGADKTIKLWSLEERGVVRTYRGHKDFVSALAWRPNGQTLASAALDGSVRLWSTSSNRLQRSLERHRGRVTALVWSANSEWLASAGEDGQIRLYDVRRGRSLRSLVGSGGATPGGPVRALVVSEDGRRISAAGDDGLVRIYEIDAAALASARED